MIITCPKCSKRYMLDNALLPKEGRQVRCVSCQHVWKQAAEESSSEQLPQKLSSNGIFAGREAGIQGQVSSSNGQRSGVFFGLACVMGLVLVGIAIFGRNAIIAQWPQSEKVYSFLGLKVERPGAGLAIVNATSKVNSEGKGKMLKVTGHILNVSDRVQTIPPLKLKLEGNVQSSQCPEGKDCVLDAWEHRLSENSLLPGEKIYFETPSYPSVEGIHHISIEF